VRRWRVFAVTRPASGLPAPLRYDIGADSMALRNKAPLGKQNDSRHRMELMTSRSEMTTRGAKPRPPREHWNAEMLTVLWPAPAHQTGA